MLHHLPLEHLVSDFSLLDIISANDVHDVNITILSVLFHIFTSIRMNGSNSTIIITSYYFRNLLDLSHLSPMFNQGYNGIYTKLLFFFVFFYCLKKVYSLTISVLKVSC